MSVKTRVKEFADNQNLSISAFEKSISASNGYVNSISKSIGLDKIETILEKYPKLNIEWLLTGNGSMLKPVNIEVVEETERIQELKYIINLQKDKITALEAENIELKSKLNISDKSTDRRAAG